jgi:serine/threonine protein kinase
VSPARLTPLQTLQHPNIIRLYEVIETTKYTGIITEYASGSELFDHILAHRYLKERDAAKLFSQIISGVWYIHRKKIVHRDLKIENLLLDCHLNVIITGFRFANRFEHQSNDLMKTSCGSPYYAAPEVILSEGPYVGSAVDIWSCGVILYAMLAGYLPFGDDPANPDGDINLLYKYIVSTPLSFPNYISPEARNLLSTMLVPNRTRRADLPSVMGHTWLAPYAHVFQRDVGELERDALEKHQAKRLARYRRMNSKSVEPIVDKPRTDQQGITQPTLVCQQGITRPTLTCVIPISCFSHLDVPPPGEEAKPRDATQIQDQFMSANIDEAQPPPVLVLAPPTPSDQARHVHPQRTSSTATDTSLTTTTTSLASRVRRFLGLDSPSPPKSLMQVHRGPVDTKLITTSPPDEAIKHVHNVLVEMGIQIFQESDYRFRCERPERVKTSASIQLQETNGPSGGEELAAVSTGDSATSNGVGDPRILVCCTRY